MDIDKRAISQRYRSISRYKKMNIGKDTNVGIELDLDISLCLHTYSLQNANMEMKTDIDIDTGIDLYLCKIIDTTSYKVHA